LLSRKYEVKDFGTDSLNSVDYPKFGFLVGEAVTKLGYDLGIVFCGTGIGASIAANKVLGVRAALIYDLNTAHLAKEHNNANVIAIGGRTTSTALAIQMIDEFLNTKFETRHQKRLDLLNDYEKKL
jgi:ribose 5-phosphate isomerase B